MVALPQLCLVYSSLDTTPSFVKSNKNNNCVTVALRATTSSRHSKLIVHFQLR